MTPISEVMSLGMDEVFADAIGRSFVVLANRELLAHSRAPLRVCVMTGAILINP